MRFKHHIFKSENLPLALKYRGISKYAYWSFISIYFQKRISWRKPISQKQDNKILTLVHGYFSQYIFKLIQRPNEKFHLSFINPKYDFRACLLRQNIKPEGLNRMSIEPSVSEDIETIDEKKILAQQPLHYYSVYKSQCL